MSDLEQEILETFRQVEWLQNAASMDELLDRKK